MTDVKWIKITTDIFDDEKILLIESLPEADSIIVIWFKLLCLAGKMNNSGVFMMNDSIAYTDHMLSTIFRRKETTVQLALKTFEEFGMIELIDNVITIPNWGKHQSLEQIEARKEYQKEYQRKYRKKQTEMAIPERKCLRESLCKQNVNSLEGEVYKEEEDNKDNKEEDNKDNKEEDNKDITNNDEKIEIGKRVIEYLNQRTGGRYKPTKSNLSHSTTRLDENYTEQDCVDVIDKKVNALCKNVKWMMQKC